MFGQGPGHWCLLLSSPLSIHSLISTSCLESYKGFCMAALRRSQVAGSVRSYPPAMLEVKAIREGNHMCLPLEFIDGELHGCQFIDGELHGSVYRRWVTWLSDFFGSLCSNKQNKKKRGRFSRQSLLANFILVGCFFRMFKLRFARGSHLHFLTNFFFYLAFIRGPLLKFIKLLLCMWCPTVDCMEIIG